MRVSGITSQMRVTPVSTGEGVINQSQWRVSIPHLRCASGGLQRRAYEVCHALHDARLAARMPVAFLKNTLEYI